MNKSTKPGSAFKTAALLAALCGGLAAPAAGVVLTGRVLDGDTDRPICGAVVSVLGTSVTTLSDITGTYTLNVPVGTYFVRITAPGMVPAHPLALFFRGDPVTLDLRLERGLSELTDRGLCDYPQQEARRRDAELSAKLDAQRLREQVSKRITWMAPAHESSTWILPARGDVVGSPPEDNGIWYHFSNYYALSRRDVGAHGLEHAIGQVPGVVIR